MEGKEDEDEDEDEEKEINGKTREQREEKKSNKIEIPT